MSAIERPSTAALEVHLEGWGLADSHQRAVKRSTSSIEEIDAFYQAMMPQLVEIIDYLDQFPLDQIPEADQTLAYAALAICEVDFAVNKWRVPNVATGINIQDMPEKTGPYARVLAPSR